MKFKIFFLLLFFMLPQSSFSQMPAVEPGVSQKLAQWRAANYSDVRYKLNITLEKMAPLMKGEIEIRVNLTEEGAKNDLILDWRTTQFANDKDKPFANVIAVNETTGAQASSLANVAESGVKTLDSDNDSSQRTSFSRFALIAGRLPALQSLALQSNEHLIIRKKFLKTGENVIKIEFASPIKSSGAAVTRYVDRIDGAEYVYSLFVPSDASTAFPVFDQPDLKAKFSLRIVAPLEWKVVSNENSIERVEILSSEKAEREKKIEKLPNGNTLVSTKIDSALTVFRKTRPISTYVFAFAAGEFVEFTDDRGKGGNATAKERADIQGSARAGNRTLPSGRVSASNEYNTVSGDRDIVSSIYVCKSQAEKFKQHAEEVFRLNREAVKFLEDWFDYKFPFPKYDLVLIPEFPFGGMEHAGATFLREDRIIFPTEPTKNDYITRANLIFHEAAHQWFGDTVTMRWFDDLWLKEGFAEFMAYKTLEKVLPEYNAWKVFYERNKQAAYLTDVTRGTTPIYQEIPNLSSAKSAYGNIVYRKAPSFLRQAEFYLGEDKFQTAVRAFLKKHEFANAEWKDLVDEFVKANVAELKKQDYYQKFSAEEKETAELGKKNQINEWANVWVKHPGMPLIRVSPKLLLLPFETKDMVNMGEMGGGAFWLTYFWQRPAGSEIGSKEAINSQNNNWKQNIEVIRVFGDGDREKAVVNLGFQFFDLSKIDFSKRDEFKFDISEKESKKFAEEFEAKRKERLKKNPLYVFPNYQDYGYGIFLLDEKSRAYVLENIQNEKDAFLRSMMWGSLWDSVRFYELAPEEYVKLVIENLSTELRLQPRETSASNGNEGNVTGSNAKITPKGVTLTETELRLQPRKTSASNGNEGNETGSNAKITPKGVTLNIAELRLQPRKTSASSGKEGNETGSNAKITPKGVTLNIAELRLQPRKTSASSGNEGGVTGLGAKITPEGVTLTEGVTFAEDVIPYDETTIATLLNRVSTAMNYYIEAAGGAQSEPPSAAGGLTPPSKNSNAKSNSSDEKLKPSAAADGSDLQAELEKLLLEKMRTASTPGQRITFYRTFVSIASSENARNVLKEILRSAGSLAGNERESAKNAAPEATLAGRLPALRSKDKFDLVTRLIILGDKDSLKLLAELEKTETDDAAKRYAYAARAGIPTSENKAKYWKDFTENKEISESWIEAAFAVWNSPRHAELTLPYLEKALAELPNLKRNRKIFFVNGWLGSFIGGQRSAEALNIVNKFLDENPDLERDLRLKILEHSDNLERAVKIREKFAKR
ncbi:MAG: hypothetical protein KIS76_17860 [Pyrinomonadaceae bacterium]|nr:hypothetical protein [Pyrinomonadaceae bacterium]